MALPSNWTVYAQFKLALGKKQIDLSADTFKVALFQSTSDCGNANHSTAKYADFTNQVANANGYTTGGASAGAGTYTNSSGTETFDTGDVSWTASGGSIVSRFAVLYDDTDTNKRAVAYCILDSTPADVTITTGNVLQIVIPKVFDLAG